MITILQGSDFHFGKPYLPQVAAAFHETVLKTNPDVIVLAGDFTQRAKIKEYCKVREFLEKLPDIPTIVTPGNHDIPLYRVHERLFCPLRNYHTYISADLNGVTRVGDVVFVDLCSAAPYRAIVNGWLSNKQLEFAARIFQECSPEDVRILVTHHPLVRPADGGSDNIMGLVSGANIIIANTRENGARSGTVGSLNININAHMIAFNESFTIQYWQNSTSYWNDWNVWYGSNYTYKADGNGRRYSNSYPAYLDDDDDRGNIYLWGGFVQVYRGYMFRNYTGPYNITPGIGMDKHYAWDDNLRCTTPPLYPESLECDDEGNSSGQYNFSIKQFRIF